MELYEETPPDLPDISKIGSLGWLCLAGFIAAWDYRASETMSAAFQRGLDNKYTRPLVLGAFAITSAHLCDILPARYDPFGYFPRMK